MLGRAPIPNIGRKTPTEKAAGPAQANLTRSLRNQTARRTKIGNQLIEGWKRTVALDYCNGHVNSERSLQALFFSNLRTVFEEDETQRRFFIEPTVRLSDDSIVRPDIVICNSREAICILELKYGPRAIVNTAKDMRSLSSIACSKDISIALERYRSPKHGPLSFALSKNVLFAWAGIHAGTAEPSQVWSDPAFQGHYYLELHAITRDGDVPTERYNKNAHLLEDAPFDA
ncbi:hypothetical protein KNO81_41225 [Paraburkholderia sediminicola]|nr:hypothetical protein [Paraburkholderia sediminicola]